MSQPLRFQTPAAPSDPDAEPDGAPAFVELLSVLDRSREPRAAEPLPQRVASAAGSSAPASSPWVGSCIDDRHPVFAGRVLVRRGPQPAADGVDATSEPDRWLPVLQGMAVRKGDRLLVLALPSAEDVVIGVLDGMRRRERPVREGGPRIELQAGETLTVMQEDGQQLLEIVRGVDGPVVRLLHADTLIELPGKLELRAAEIALVAQRGSVRVEASDDVVVVGETVRLN